MRRGFAGVHPPARMQGRDFSPLYRPDENPETSPWRKEFFYEHGTINNKKSIPSSEAVVCKDLKYTRWSEWDYEELFDLTKDPFEQKNLIGASAYAGKLSELRDHLKTLQAEAR